MGTNIAHNRLLQVIDYLHSKGKARTHTDIATALNMQQPHVTAAIKGHPKRFTSGFLKRFAAAYADHINPDWLISGIGDMVRPDPTYRPDFDAKASAGFLDGITGDGTPASAPVCAPIPFIPPYDFTITVSGDSMTPTLADGDRLACRLISDPLNPPIGKICVFDTREGAVVKVLHAVNDNTVTLRSLNPRYPDIILPGADIRNTARVIARLSIID